MLIRNLLLFMLGFFTLAVTAHSQNPPTSTCQSTYTTGSTYTLLRFCVTANGNITRFESPLGFEHIREGDFGDGYGICDVSPVRGYFDYADLGDSGNWGPPIIAQPHGADTFPLKIERTTSDGVFTLTQNFSRNSGERIAKVQMTLQNNSGVSKVVQLLRFADIDANNADGGDYMNDFDFAVDAAWGYNQGRYGLKLSAVPDPSNPGNRRAVAQSVASGPDPCQPFAHSILTHPFLGDGSVLAYFVFGLDPGKSKTVSFEYRAF